MAKKTKTPRWFILAMSDGTRKVLSAADLQSTLNTYAGKVAKWWIWESIEPPPSWVAEGLA